MLFVTSMQGLKFLLENHLSHPLLKTQLCCLRDLIHDISEKVRSAFMDLLLLVKGIKAIKVRNNFKIHFLVQIFLQHPGNFELLVTQQTQQFIYYRKIHKSETIRVLQIALTLMVYSFTKSISKSLFTMQFWTIVPLEHLLACLEVETSAPVLRKLVKLLMNSFHPLNKEADIQVTLFIQFLMFCLNSSLIYSTCSFYLCVHSFIH